MIGIYSSENDIETAFDWSTSGFSVANTPEQKKSLTTLTKRPWTERMKVLLKNSIKKILPIS